MRLRELVARPVSYWFNAKTKQLLPFEAMHHIQYVWDNPDVFGYTFPPDANKNNIVARMHSHLAEIYKRGWVRIVLSIRGELFAQGHAKDDVVAALRFFRKETTSATLEWAFESNQNPSDSWNVYLDGPAEIMQFLGSLSESIVKLQWAQDQQSYGFLLYRNPSKPELIQLLKSSRETIGNYSIRGIWDGSNLWLWDGYYATHRKMMTMEGLHGYTFYLDSEGSAVAAGDDSEHDHDLDRHPSIMAMKQLMKRPDLAEARLAFTQEEYQQAAAEHSEYPMVEFTMDQQGNIRIMRGRDRVPYRYAPIATLYLNAKEIRIRTAGNQLLPSNQQLIAGLLKAGIIDDSWKIQGRGVGRYVGHKYQKEPEDYVEKPISQISSRSNRLDPAGIDLVFYHGTSNVDAERIMKFGLRSLDESNVDHGFESRAKHAANAGVVYLTTTMEKAWGYAQTRAESLKRRRKIPEYVKDVIYPVILKITLPNASKLVSDDDAVNEIARDIAERLWKKKTPEEKARLYPIIAQNSRVDIRTAENLGAFLWRETEEGFAEILSQIPPKAWKAWMASIRRRDQVGYKGRIPPAWIEMRLRESVMESMDRVLPSTVIMNTKYRSGSAFITPNGIIYSVYFKSMEYTPEDWEMYFESDIHGTKNSNSGDEFWIFATVLSITEQFIKSRKPKSIAFTGSKGEGKADLYSVMARRFTPRLTQLGYYIDVEPEKNETYFYINRKPIAESMSSDVQAILQRAKQMGFSGFGDDCGQAAVAINRVLFSNTGRLAGGFNVFFMESGYPIGHVAVEKDGVYWDADGKPKHADEILSWGMLAVDDPDYQERAREMGEEWTEARAEDTAMYELSEQEALVFGSDKLDAMIAILKRAVG